jgi:TolA-binding protein
MDKTYRQPVRAVYMGEKVCLRVIDPTADKTGDKDVVSVQIRSGKREPVTLALNETFPHTGVFRSVLQLASSQDASSTNALGVLPVDYGDSVVMSYVGGSTEEKLDRTVKIAMGSDGSIQSFTKRFKDPSIAVQTQFTVAESYFELAKNHRALKQEELARREIAQGRKLLEEAIRDFPQTEARAQAEYLLAELSLELAQDATTAEAKKKHSADALQRYIDIVVTYPDSPYAPKAQFKKGMTLEKLGQIDDACEEYVKLSYKHPDSELVAETIARLGQYFLTKGKGFETQIAGAGNLVQKEKLRLQSVDMFKTAAQVFGRLAKRFPDHQLAAKTTVLSGQCWMRAADYERAVETFRLVTEGKRTEPELVAEAMYWCGDAYMKDAKKSPGKVVDAYRMFKKLTWDYPESQWAKYARGRLTDPVLAQADSAGEG